MSVFRIICRDRIPAHARTVRHWSPEKGTRVASELNALFLRVAVGVDYQPTVEFSDATPGPKELVVYFLETRESSIIKRLTHQTAGTAAGATIPVATGMISEVYIANISVVPGAIANLAFHELMHNKLDAQTNPRDRVVRDIHTQGGGGLATGDPINERTPLTPRNIELMRRGFDREIPQYIGP